MNECLLGFDARVKWVRYGRPKTFLLREDVDELLSADTMVWPSIFHRGFPNYSELPRPPWIGANDPFWESLDALEAAIPPGGAWRQGEYWLIAATWHAPGTFEAQERQSVAGHLLGPRNLPTEPSKRHSAWRFLGFDVTDGGFLSGLTNCGYDDEERPGLARAWTPFLNPHHLFADVNSAFEFRDLANGRVREHAPFFVIGLWLIREVR